MHAAEFQPSLEMLLRFAALLAFALALWIAAAIVCPPHRSRGGDAIRTLLRGVAFILGIVALVALLFRVSSVFGFPLVFIAAWLAVFTFLRFYNSERRLLIDILALAAERNVPLHLALRAFAADRFDRLGRTARKTAENLELGQPLDAALSAAGALVPPDVLLAIRTGTKNNRLAAALAEARERYGRLDYLWQPLLLKAIYLGVVGVVLTSVLTFVLLKIMPTYQKMFKEFDLKLPAVTELVIFLSTFAGKFAAVWVPALVLAALFSFFFILLPIELNASGFLSWEPLVGRRFLRRLDAAVILRVLGQGVRRGMPLPESLAQLAEWYPRRSVRKLLTKAQAAVATGTNWREALLRWRLIRKPEAALLDAAERTGHLGWAMLEIADGAERRFVYRTQSILSVVFPIFLLALGIVVLLIAVAIMLPLSGLVENLSR